MNFNAITDLLNKLDTENLTGKTILSNEEAGEKFLDFLKYEKHIELGEMQDILKETENSLVISCAGSGKTTTMTYKIQYDKIIGNLGDSSGECRTWLCTFLKKGAEDMKLKLEETNREYAKYCEKHNIKYSGISMNEINVSTMHSEFYQVLKSIVQTVNIVDADKNRKYLADTLKSLNIRYEGRSEKSDIVRDMMSALGCTRNTIGSKRYDIPIYRSLRLTNTTVELILDLWKEKRREDDVYDFEDLQEILYEECYIKSNPTYINAIKNRYDYIYIDEFQDTSSIQYELLKIYTKGNTRILAIGDDDQSIYSWRGGCNEIICRTYQEDYHPKVHKLSLNYRCPENILKPAATSIQYNETRLDKDIKAYKSGGTFYVDTAYDYENMGMHLVKELRENIDSSKRDNVLLVRTNSDAIYPALLCAKEGIKFCLHNKQVPTTMSLVRSVMGVLNLFNSKVSEDTLRVLKLRYPKDVNAAKGIWAECKTGDKSLWEISVDTYEKSDNPLYSIIASWVTWRNELSDKECLLAIFDDFIDNSFNSLEYNQYNEALLSIFRAVRDLVDLSDAEDIFELREEIRNYFSILDNSRELEESSVDLVIATVHEYKGAQADTVYIWNDTKKMFPHQLGNQKLTKDEFEEERRVHYIACTRAQNKCVIFTVNKLEGQFLLESLGGYVPTKKKLSIVAR